MRIRTGDLDQGIRAPGVHSKLNMSSSPLGGDFGRVRSFGQKIHQGWDLYAAIGTPVYAVCGGEIVFATLRGDYGQQICLQLDCPEAAAIAQRIGAKHLYAFYGHLRISFVAAGSRVREGDQIGLSGNSGNAGNTPPHLHFEIRTDPNLGRGLQGRVNPAEVLGYRYYQCHL